MCPRCGRSLRVFKTSRRSVVTLLHGSIVAREIQSRCPACRVVVRSQRLAEMVPRNQRYGYDLIVWVGRRRWLDRLQRVEIRDRLETCHGIRLSATTISALADRFLAHLGALHRQAVPALRQAMDGGYPLHVDATTHQGRGGQFVCYDGRRGWVLQAGRIAGERTEEVELIVDQTVKWFGLPMAVVRDQGKACKAAVAPLVAAGVPDLLCHFHVLKNLGTALLDRSYNSLKTRWERLKAGSTLKDLLRSLYRGPTAAHVELGAAVLWVLQGSGPRTSTFPFGLPILDQVVRLTSLQEQLGNLVDLRRCGAVSDELETLRHLISEIANDSDLATLQAEVRRRQHALDEVRTLFRLVDPSTQEHPALPEIEAEQIREVQEDLTKFRTVLSRRIRKATGDHRAALKTVFEMLDRVKGQLFGHPVVRDATGKVLFVVARTNNSLEQHFGRQNQDIRRRTGRMNLGRDLEDLPAEVALVSNLKRPDYVRIVAGSLDQLPARFATVQPLSERLRPRPYRHLRQHLKAACSSLASGDDLPRQQVNPTKS